MDRQRLLRLIIAAVAVIIAILLIIGIIMAITRTGLFTAKQTTPSSQTASTENEQAQGNTNNGTSSSTLPSDTNSTNSATSTTPVNGTNSSTIPSTGPSDTITIAIVALALFGGTYATALCLRSSRA